jgi:hypothetical protein
MFTRWCRGAEVKRYKGEKGQRTLDTMGLSIGASLKLFYSVTLKLRNSSTLHLSSP